jgi:aminopeptidase
MLFDEKIGGTVHLALGRSYPETGGKNVSALHWDLICDLRGGGRITADGATVQQDGHFTL